MSDKFLIPSSIILAGLLIGGGFLLSKDKNTKISPQEALVASKNIREISDTDHLLGSPRARIILVEYSDTECPYCKDFHQTLRALMSEYGSEGKLAWIYRHFPIAELHSKAPKEAEALECAGELGGNSKFWEYTNRIYEITPANNGLKESELGNIAKYVGLSSTEFNTCLASGKFKNKVAADVEDAISVGAEGTPYSVLLDTKTGDTYPLPAAQPYVDIKNIIDLILQS